MIEINRFYIENCIDTMSRMPDNFIDLTVTSPPYDELRDYNGYSFDFENIAKELYRVTKEGGVVVWVVNDSTVNGSETLTSAKQKIFFREQCGFNIRDTMIYRRNTPNPQRLIYKQEFEYIFILAKGINKTFNSIVDVTIRNKARIVNTVTKRQKDGTLKPAKFKCNQKAQRGNV